jgi:hypothetical protein
VVGHPCDWTKSQEDRPPTAIVSLDQINMTSTLNRARFEIAMCQNWISRIAFEWSPRTTASGDRFRYARTPCRPRRSSGINSH